MLPDSDPMLMARHNVQFHVLPPGLLRSSLVILSVLCGTSPLVAQDAVIRLGPDIPTSTRAMALGGAYMMNAGQPDAVFQHPELLRTSRGLSLDVQRWGDAASATSASAATPWFGGDVGVAIGLQLIQHTQTPANGTDGQVAQDPLFEHEGVHVSERIASVGIGRAMGDVDWGVALRFAEAREGDAAPETELALTLGASREVGPLTVGVAYRDILRSVSDLTVGVGAYGWQLGILDVGVSARVDGFDDDVRYGGGVEVGYWPIRGRTFVARVGVQNVPEESAARPVTFGFAYWGDALVLEWGYQPFQGASEGGTHRFSLGWR